MVTYRDELEWAYNGEVYGEAMFDAMAEVVEDPRRSAWLRLCGVLERQTKEDLGQLCDREGIARDDATWEAKGRGIAERAARPGWEWDRFLRSFSPVTGPALLRYRHMRDVLAPEGDAAAMAALVAHEDALQHLADGLLADDADPAGPLLRTLRDPHRAQAEGFLQAVTEPQ
jgi:hypothetical protein